MTDSERHEEMIRALSLTVAEQLGQVAAQMRLLSRRAEQLERMAMDLHGAVAQLRDKIERLG